MNKGRSKLFNRLMHRRVMKRWATAVAEAPTADLSRLRVQRNAARELRGQLNSLLQVADGRLAMPHANRKSIPLPSGANWAWRPMLWSGALADKGIASAKNKTRIGEDVAIFHDCKASELTLRQVRNTDPEALAPFGLRLDVFNFDGSFLSLVLDFPPDAIEGLRKKHIVKVCCHLETERPIEVFMRLNIKNGPNTEQMVQELPMDGSEQKVEFDLAYTEVNERRLEAIWMDLIFENPDMNQIVIRDLTCCRYPRAEL